MHVLDHTFVWDWCRQHGVALLGGNAMPSEPIRLADDSTLTHRERRIYAEGEKSGRERAVAAAAVRALGPWDECLVWITEVGVWASSEDWPRFYTWRGTHGEKRSVEAAPGHVFQAGEMEDLEELLTQILESGWDATVIPATGGMVLRRRIVTSHDEWIDVRSAEPVEFPVVAA
jgi:hypothetical protein